MFSNLSVPKLSPSHFTPYISIALAFSAGAILTHLLPVCGSVTQYIPGLNKILSFIPRLKFKEERLLHHVIQNSTIGDPQSVLDAIDHFGWNTEFLMNVGDKKGVLVDNVIKSKNPKKSLELGAFVGYSAVRSAMRMNEMYEKEKKNSDGKSAVEPPVLISVEFNPTFACIASRVIQRAGMDHIVTVLDGTLSSTVSQIQSMGISSFDYIFIDHWKESYAPDFLLLEHHGFIKKGTVIVADNMTYPGSPEFRKLMVEKGKTEYDVRYEESTLEYSKMKDEICIAVKK